MSSSKGDGAHPNKKNPHVLDSTWTWLSDLYSNPEMHKPPEIIIPKLMWRKARVCLFSREKGGKSTLLAYAVARASQGLTFLEEECPQSTFLWVGLEEILSEAVRRFERFGGDGKKIAFIHKLSRNWVKELAEAIKETEADGVIIDTLPQLLSSAGVRDENDAGGINAQVIPALTRLTRDKNVGILLNHHVTKSEGGPRGSTAITAGMDTNLTMRAPDGNLNPRRIIESEGRWANEKFAVEFDGQDFELTEGAVSIDERVFRFIKKNTDCSWSAISDGVPGGTTGKREALKSLEDAGRIMNYGDTTRAKYRVTEILASTANGTATYTAENHHSTTIVEGLSTATVLNSQPLESSLVQDQISEHLDDA